MLALHAHTKQHHFQPPWLTLSLQAYRRLALVKHPDKAKTPNAGLCSIAHVATGSQRLLSLQLSLLLVEATDLQDQCWLLPMHVHTHRVSSSNTHLPMHVSSCVWCVNPNLAHAACWPFGTAAQEFDELKKAYAILSDKSARGALDDYLE